MRKTCETCKHYSESDEDAFMHGVYKAVFRNSCELHEEPMHRFWEQMCEDWEPYEEEIEIKEMGIVFAEDVAELESKYAELESKCAELESKHEKLRAASFELVFLVGLTPFSGDFPARELTRICNEVLALVDPLKKQTKSEGEEMP